MGLLRAILDAIHGEDDRIAGMRLTRLVAPLSATETVQMDVESTLGFGETEDGTANALLLVGGEVISANNRVDGPATFQFTGLSRALEGSQAQLHPPGTLVYDLARNSSALDHVRRGLFVDTALGEDLDVVGRNLGLKKCPGLVDSQWRAIIKAVAYLPKQPRDAFEQALLALLGSAAAFAILERAELDPWKVFVEIDVGLATDIRGRMLLNGGEPQLTTGLTSVDVDYAVNHVLGVYDDTPLTRMGLRDGFTNYATSDTFVGQTITLDVSPGAAGTPVLVDYGAFPAHYLALDETVRQDLSDADHWAYLADPLLTARCLLNQVRAAGIVVELSTML